jgi:hypothetical protein
VVALECTRYEVIVPKSTARADASLFLLGIAIVLVGPKFLDRKGKSSDVRSAAAPQGRDSKEE